MRFNRLEILRREQVGDHSVTEVRSTLVRTSRFTSSHIIKPTLPVFKPYSQRQHQDHGASP